VVRFSQALSPFCEGGRETPWRSRLLLPRFPKEVVEDEIRPVGDRDFRQHDDVVAERGIDGGKSIIFGDRLVEAMAPLGVGRVDFGPA
jgi:hypothetical protein